jgi:catechol 2,3-dioxygenase-like lactoylglutathione lyase family enzyme
VGCSNQGDVLSDLVADLHHMTFLTADLDRLIDFYVRIFDAKVTLDRVNNGRRHAFIEIGPHTVLHPFEVPASVIPGRQEIFQRGRLDHFALNATSAEAFLEIRRRLLAEGVYAIEDGLVTDMGAMWSLSFHDPDDAWQEVIWVKPDASLDDFKDLSEWEMIDPEA